MNKFAALALASAVLTPFGAMAGGMTEPPVEPPVTPVVVAPVAPSVDWTGFYGGASLGYGNINATTDAASGSGALGGLLGGYRHDFGNWVGGVEVDYDWANADLGNTGDGLDAIYRLKLQAGADLGRTLVYGTAGIARANTTFGGSSLNSNGWVAGVGADYAINDRWLVGGEVLWNQFDNFANTGENADMSTIKARVAYRF